MAEHATHEYATATGNDYAEHERTYAFMMKLSRVATAAIVLIVISLAIGGVAGDWTIAGLGVVLAVVAGAISGMSEKGSLVPIGVAGLVVLALHFMFG